MKKKENKEKIEKKKIVRWESQVKIVVIFMIILILAVIAVYYFIISSKNFEYAGIDFTKTQNGPLTLYLAKFPMWNSAGELTRTLNIYFRENPKKLKRISIDSQILLKNNVGIAINKEFRENCSDSFLAGVTLGSFLKEAGLKVYFATNDKEEAKADNRTYVDCSATQDSIVIFKKSNESRIEKAGECYTLYAGNNCEIMNVSERFMVGLYATAVGKSL